ncbi:MAG: HlyD family efflux transporter periplasmic adaptor subunit [Burkholderiaceae bacterium]
MPLPFPAPRKPPVRPRVAAALAAGALACAGCEAPPPAAYQGYVEGEFVQVASPVGGVLETLPVQRGETVAAGAPLFALERALESAAVEQALAQASAAQSREANLRAARRRPEQLAVEAQVANAQAALRLSALQLEQQERLARSGFVSEAALASARAANERDRAQLDAAQAQLATTRLSLGRDAELAAAQADVRAAEAALAQARTRLAQKAPAAPADAKVQDTFFRVGEWVPPAVPVVSLLPPGNVKLRFFVPETALATVRAGTAVVASCDGCPAPVAARVNYVSSQAEYTPPVIYSRESRAKLVFLVEARPEGDAGRGLVPGQPVDVRVK